MWRISRVLTSSPLTRVNNGLSRNTRTFERNVLRSRHAEWRPYSTSKLPEQQSSSGSSTGQPQEESKLQAVSSALSQTASSADNTLLSPVHIPEDPLNVLKENHPAISILGNSSIVVQRQIEMMNILIGFEQANKYIIMDPQGNHIGYLAEQEHGMGNAVARQFFATHRSFTTHVFDKEQQEVLRFHRPFSYILSRIRVHDAIGHSQSRSHLSSASLQGTSTTSLIDPNSVARISPLQLSEMPIIGEAQQQWAPLRRKYNLFVHRNLVELEHTTQTPQIVSGHLPVNSTSLQVSNSEQEMGYAQFAYVNEPFLSWDFSLLSADKQLIGSVNRNFRGFAREIFTDTGLYALRMDAAGLSAEPKDLASQEAEEMHTETMKNIPGMTLDQRAVMLATAVSIDFDYFSRHSSSTPMMPFFIPIGGEAGGAAAGGAAAEGAVGGAVAGAASRATVAEGVASGAAGAGTMAGYEAMRGAQGRGDNAQQTQQQQPDDMSPIAQDPNAHDNLPNSSQTPYGEDVWGSQQDPWANKDDNDPWSQGPGSGGSGGGGQDGGDDGSFFDDFL